MPPDDHCPTTDAPLPGWLGRLYDAIISLILFALAYALRAIAPTAMVSWDEPVWVLRSARFLLALRSGDLAQTLQTGHPGVITMWLGALSLNWHRLVTGQVSWAAIESTARIDFAAQVQDTSALRELTALLPYAKIGIWLLNALIVVGVYLLLRRLLSRRLAVVAGLTLAVSPYYVGLGRLLHLDALMSGFMLLAVLAALLYWDKRPTWALLLSGAMAACATLTRSAGLLVVPVALALIVWANWRSGQGRWRSVARGIGLWAGAAVLTFVALWPAMWVSPLAALKEVIALSWQYTQIDPGATATFFRGQTVEQASAWFYPVVVWFRLTPLATIFAPFALLAALVRLPEDRDPSRQRVVWALTGFAVYVLLALTLSAKQFDRYALPAVLALELLGGLGLAQAADFVADKVLRPGALRFVWRALIVALTSTVLLGLSWLAEVAPLFPAHWLAAYNSFAGGLARAVQTIPVGWGEGLPEAATSLNEQPGAENLTVATWGAAGLVSTFAGQTVPLRGRNLPAADYVLVYVSDVQNGDSAALRYYEDQSPLAVSTIDDVPIAWLFDNDDPAAGNWLAYAQAWLDSTQPNQSVVLSNADSALVRRYASGDWAVLPMDDLSAAAQVLAQATQGRAAVIYLRYPWYDETGRLAQRRLDQSALLMETFPLELGEARRYALFSDAPLSEVEAHTPAGAHWASGLRLQALGLSEQAQYRQSVGIALQMVADSPQSTNWQLFARVLDDQGRAWGELDDRLLDIEGLDAGDWQPGQSHECRYSIPLRAGIPWGMYQVVVGLYDLDTMARVDLLDEAGNPAGTTFSLGRVQVEPALVSANHSALAEYVALDQELSGLSLLGYALDAEGYATGEQVDLALFWQPAGRVAADAQALFGWRAPDDTVTWLPALPLPGEGRDSQDWGAKDALEIHYALRVPESLPEGEATLLLNLRLGDDGEPLLPADLEIAAVPIAQVKRLYSVPAMQHTQGAQWGDAARLLGYNLAATTEDGRRTAEITLYWQAPAATGRELVAFVHLLDADGMVRAQVDQQPVQGTRPTSGWVEGEIIIDPYALSLPDDAPAGPYRVEIGLYDPQTLAREPVSDAEGISLPNDALILDAEIAWPE